MTAPGGATDRGARDRNDERLLLEFRPTPRDVGGAVILALILGFFATWLAVGFLAPKSTGAVVIGIALLVALVLFYWYAAARDLVYWKRVWLDHCGLTWETSLLGRRLIRRTDIPLDEIQSVFLEGWDDNDHFAVFDTSTMSKRWVFLGRGAMVDGAIAPRILARWQRIFDYVDPSKDLSGLLPKRRPEAGSV